MDFKCYVPKSLSWLTVDNLGKYFYNDFDAFNGEPYGYFIQKFNNNVFTFTKSRMGGTGYNHRDLNEDLNYILDPTNPNFIESTIDNYVENRLRVRNTNRRVILLDGLLTYPDHTQYHGNIDTIYITLCFCEYNFNNMIYINNTINKIIKENNLPNKIIKYNITRYGSALITNLINKDNKTNITDINSSYPYYFDYDFIINCYKNIESINAYINILYYDEYHNKGGVYDRKTEKQYLNNLYEFNKLRAIMVNTTPEYLTPDVTTPGLPTTIPNLVKQFIVPNKFLFNGIKSNIPITFTHTFCNIAPTNLKINKIFKKIINNNNSPHRKKILSTQNGRNINFVYIKQNINSPILRIIKYIKKICIFKHYLPIMNIIRHNNIIKLINLCLNPSQYLYQQKHNNITYYGTQYHNKYGIGYELTIIMLNYYISNIIY